MPLGHSSLSASPAVLAVRFDKQEADKAVDSPNSSAMSDGAKRSAKATPVRMPPRPSTGDSKGRQYTGSSPAAATSRHQVPLPMRDSAELRRQRLSTKDSRKSPGDMHSGLDLTLTGKHISPDHPLLGGGTPNDADEAHQLEDASCQMRQLDGISSRGGLTGAHTGPDDGLLMDGTTSCAEQESGEEESIKLDDEERILSECWQDSSSLKGSDQGSGGERDHNASPPSSRYESVNNSAEQACSWSPETRRVTGVSVHEMSSRAYEDEDDSVNQSHDAIASCAADDNMDDSLPACLSGAGSSENSSLPFACEQPPRQAQGIGTQRASEITDTPTSRLRGTIAARAMMGRKRVYGAVVIQRWFRVLLRRQEQRQRDDVKSLLRERLQKKGEQEQARRMAETEKAAKLRSEKEQGLKAAIEQREAEVQRATERLKRSLDGASSEGMKADSYGSRHDGDASVSTHAADPAVVPVLPSPPTQSPLSLTAQATRILHGLTGNTHEVADDVERQVSGACSATSCRAAAEGDDHEMMQALRASVERSADLLGLSRAMALAPRDDEAVLTSNALEVGGAGLDERDAQTQDELFYRDHSAQACRSSHMGSPLGARRSGSVLERREAMIRHELVVASSNLSPYTSPMRTPDANGEHQAQQCKMETAAKELQSSILSFLESAEADTASLHASFSCAGGEAVLEVVQAGGPEQSSEAMCGSLQRHGPRRALALPDDPTYTQRAGQVQTKGSAADVCTYENAARPPLASAALPHSSSVGLLDESMPAMSAPASASTSLSLASSPSLSSRGQVAPVLAAQVFGDVKARMASLKVELEYKDKTIADLNDALRRHKERFAAQEEAQAENLSSQLAMQRLEYEAQVKRQLEFVDQLVNDKAALSSKCEDLAAEFELVQRKFQEQIKAIEDRQVKELKKQRESMAVSEKIRRDTWMQEKSREIKEMTVKGLEPEIQRLLTKHKKELERMEQANAQELKRQRDALAEAHERSMSEVRERMMIERDRAVEREREASSVRLREQNDRFDQQLQAQRVRLADDMAQERERLEAAHRSERQRVEDMYGMQIKDDSRKLAEMQCSWAEREEQLQRRHASELSRLREQADIEKHEWQKTMREKMEQEREEVLKSLHAKMEQQRDQEIDLVIVRLEEEAEVTKAKLTKEAEDKAHRIVAQCEEQVQEAKEAEKQVMDKYLALFKQHTTADERMNERILELQADKARAEQALQRLEHARQQDQTTHASRIDALRCEWSGRLQDVVDKKEALEEQVRRARIECKEIMVKHEHEVGQLKKQKMEELDAINARVRATVAKKDEIVVALQQEVREAEGRVLQYEQILQRQRQELLS